MSKPIAILAAAALALTGYTLPVAAKTTPIRSSEVWHDITELEQDVNRADVRDTISEREAAGLRAQIDGLKKQYHKLNRGGLTPGEANAIESRIRTLRSRLGNERHDPDHHRG